MKKGIVLLLVFTGKTWSPEDRTPMQRLVAVADELYALSSGKKVSEAKNRTEIRKLIRTLEE